MLRVILLLLSLTLPLLAQEEEKPKGNREIFKATGEIVTITWEWDYEDVASELANWVVCRQPGVSGRSTCVTVAPEKRQFDWPMPDSTVSEYRLRLYSQGVDGLLSVAGDELTVLRKP